MRSERKTEGWVEFTRIPCKKGFIDYWMGDCINNPNNDKKSHLGLNAVTSYYRLNGKGVWVKSGVIKHMMKILELLSHEKSAKEIWDIGLGKKPNYNIWLVKLQKDLKQNKYNLTREGIYLGSVEEHIEALLDILKNDYDMKI